jgi:hypothetical protein
MPMASSFLFLNSALDLVSSFWMFLPLATLSSRRPPPRRFLSRDLDLDRLSLGDLDRLLCPLSLDLRRLSLSPPLL